MKRPAPVLSLHRPRPYDRPFFHCGRLYKGYVGIYWITRFFILTAMIGSWEKA